MGKSQKLINVATGNELYDKLHTRTQTSGVCTTYVCNGSSMLPKKHSILPRSKDEVTKLAKEFIDEYYGSIKRSGSEQHQQRWEQIKHCIELTGTYELTETELVYGTKLAWRNAPRCIGRIQWSKLQVFDARYVTTASGMFEALCKHIKYGTNKGNIRSAITIFPHRTDGKHDFRVWNSQLISYAGYKAENGSIIGDPLSVEFTEICQKFGWKGKGGKWDVLPIVLSAGGQDPEWFEIPSHLVMQVNILHPEFKWFNKLCLKWYVLPAVANLLFDCGGLEFPAAPFNGWYMVTEIATRDLCDQKRFNILEEVALQMGLDTSLNTNLWKDQVTVEMNRAVLHSFQQVNATIVDHHTAAESFMKHFENEHRLRGGCPADWVWLTPPISGSLTPVFHQEMSLYYLKPSYEYQDPAWKTHVWKKCKEKNRNYRRKSRKKFRFKEIARAVKFTSKLFGKALSKRIKATILYATETGKSENYAKKLDEIFGHTFNSQVHCMEDYDIINIEHETLLLFVTSTFGNGDPPENGESFARYLYAMKVTGTSTDVDNETGNLQRSFSFMRMTSHVPEMSTPNSTSEKCLSSPTTLMIDDCMGPLSNVSFAVFALGSSAYPNFCAYGKYIDNLLSDLGGERIVPITCGDELAGQEQQFKLWAAEVFKSACEAFCVEDDENLLDATAALTLKTAACAERVKIVKVSKETCIDEGLSKTLNKKVKSYEVLASRNLHGENASRWTQQVIIKRDGTYDLQYQPGDHLAIVPANRKCIVQGIIDRLKELDDPDQPYEVLVLKEIHTSNGSIQTWEPHEKLPRASITNFLTRYLDITTPPTPNFLSIIAGHAKNKEHQDRLEQLSSNLHEYEDWKHSKYPHLLDVLDEFSSVDLEPSILLTQLPLLQSRFYSISSSPLLYKTELHITVAVVIYRTECEKGSLHYGVCSNYLKEVKPGNKLQCFVRSAPGFRLPNDIAKPLILVGPGTGIAPFRSFWQQWAYKSLYQKDKTGEITLFFGCRTRALDLYKHEKMEMLEAGILSKTYLALSREPSIPKTYVQDMLNKASKDVFRQIVLERGHFYVCGDCTMAECVYQRLRNIIQEEGSMTEHDVDNYILQMREENRYHEDIFGITLRTEEVHRQTRETARSKVNHLSKSSINETIDSFPFIY